MSQSNEKLFSSSESGGSDGEQAREPGKSITSPTPKRVNNTIRPANFFGRTKNKRSRSPYVPETSSSCSENDDDEIPSSQRSPLRKKSRTTTSRWSPDEAGLQDTLGDIKSMLQVLFDKVEKNEKSLNELRDSR